MFDELNKYSNNGHFFFKPEDNLTKVCNAPNDKSGVYLIYALANGRIDLVYVGYSGETDGNGLIYVRKSGLGGIKDGIVNGRQFGKIPRRKSWPTQMRLENIEALDIYWFITHDKKMNDYPAAVVDLLIDKHIDLFGLLPRWNKV